MAVSLALCGALAACDSDDDGGGGGGGGEAQGIVRKAAGLVGPPSLGFSCALPT